MHTPPHSTASVLASEQSSQHDSTAGGHHRPQEPSVSGEACPNCGTRIETVDTSEAVCPDCNVVISAEPVSRAPRPDYGDNETSSAQTGSRVTFLYADRGLGTGIDRHTTTDGDGRALSKTQRRLVQGMGWMSHLSTEDVRLDYALGEIRRMGGELGVPESEREEAARLYRRALREDAVAGRSVDGFAAACLLAAVRQSSLRLPVSESEIEAVSRATREQFRTARGVLEVRLNVEIPPMDPQDFLPRAMSRLSAPGYVERCARRLLDARKADEDDCRSISPRTLAAAAVHAAFDMTECEDRPPLAAVSDVLDVSISTISERKSDLVTYYEAYE